MKKTAFLKRAVLSLGIASILATSQFAQAKKIFITEQFQGRIPFAKGIPIVGELTVGKTVSTKTVSIIDDDHDPLKGSDIQFTAAVTWFLVDKDKIADATAKLKDKTVLLRMEKNISEVISELEGVGITILNSGKASDSITIPAEGAGSHLGYYYTPETTTGYPNKGNTLVVMNALYLGSQDVNGVNIDTEKANNKSGVIDKIEDNGLIDHDSTTLTAIITLFANDQVQPARTEDLVVYDDTKGESGKINLLPIPRPQDKFGIKIFAPGNKDGEPKDVTELYKNTIQWGLYTQAGDDLYAIDDVAVKEGETTDFLFPVDTTDPTTFQFQDRNPGKALYKHPIHKSQQSTRLYVVFGEEPVATPAEATTIQADTNDGSVNVAQSQ